MDSGDFFRRFNARRRTSSHVGGESGADLGGRDPNFIRTLAAARAEAGQFAEAVATAEAAKALASTQNKPELASRLEEEIALYRARVALRE